MNSFEHLPSFLKSELQNYYSAQEIDDLFPAKSFYTKVGHNSSFQEIIRIPFNWDYYNDLDYYNSPQNCGIEIYDIIDKFIETQINNGTYRAMPITYDQIDKVIYPEQRRINPDKTLGIDFRQYLVFNLHSEFSGAIIITENTNELIITVSSMY